MTALTRAAPEIPVTHMKAALEYYAETLGFTVAMTMPGGDYAIVERDGVALHLFHDQDASLSPVGFHLFVSGLEELYAELEKRGARVTQAIERKPWGNRDFRLVDPSGNSIKFTEPLEG